MDRETILRRAAKLMQFQAGNATQNELELAATRLGELMREHNISMGEITAEQLKGNIGEESAVQKYAKRFPAWYQLLASKIAYAASCEWSRMNGKIVYYGDKSDVAVAVYFMNVCSEALPFLCELYKPACNKAFLWAAVEAIGDRLCNMIRPPEISTQERGLIVAKAEATHNWMRLRFGVPEGEELRKGKMRVNQGHDGESYAMGTEAGNNMRLNHGLAKGNDNPSIGVTH